MERGDGRRLPFGKVRTDVGPITQTDLGYTGQRNLADIGLMDYHARMYDAALGRFIQPDSTVPGAGNPQALNRYSYVFNNPIGLSDPSGHGMNCPDLSGYMCGRRLGLRAAETSPGKSTANNAGGPVYTPPITLLSVMNWNLGNTTIFNTGYITLNSITKGWSNPTSGSGRNVLTVDKVDSGPSIVLGGTPTPIGTPAPYPVETPGAQRPTLTPPASWVTTPTPYVRQGAMWPWETELGGAPWLPPNLSLGDTIVGIYQFPGSDVVSQVFDFVTSLGDVRDSLGPMATEPIDHYDGTPQPIRYIQPQNVSPMPVATPFIGTPTPPFWNIP